MRDDELSSDQISHAKNIFMDILLQSQSRANNYRTRSEKYSVEHIITKSKYREEHTKISYLRGILNYEIFSQYINSRCNWLNFRDLYLIARFIEAKIDGLRVFSKYPIVRPFVFAYRQEIFIKIILNSRVVPEFLETAKRSYPGVNRAVYINFDEYDHFLLIQRTKNINKIIANIPRVEIMQNDNQVGYITPIAIAGPPIHYNERTDQREEESNKSTEPVKKPDIIDEIFKNISHSPSIENDLLFML